MPIPVVNPGRGPLERVEVAAFRGLDAVLADLGRLTVFVGRNGSGKTNVITALSALHPVLLADLLMEQRMGSGTAMGTLPPVTSRGRTRPAAIAARGPRGVVVLEIGRGGRGGLVATWSHGQEVVARLQVDDDLTTHVLQRGADITPFDRRRHKRRALETARGDLAALQEELFGPWHAAFHGEEAGSARSLEELELRLVSTASRVPVRAFLDLMTSRFDLPPLSFVEKREVPHAILPTPESVRRMDLRESQLDHVRDAVAATLPDTRSAGREVIAHLDSLLDPGEERQVGGGLRLRESHLPATSLGAGHRSLLSMCHAILRSDVCFIDEPDVFLHPSLQERVVDFLVEESARCQIVVATHSHVLLNALFERHARVYELLESGAPHRNGVRSMKENDLGPLLDGLGVRAGHVLQANALVWVEGPSDAIYLRHWIDLWSDGHLIYGTDYSILSYNGSDLRRMCLPGASDPFAGLARISRHSIIVMDSDLGSEGEPLDPYKLGIRASAEAAGGIGWITAGKTIENYIPLRIMRNVGYAGTADGVWYLDVPKFMADRVPAIGRRKVRIAEYIAPQMTLEDLVYTGDLGTQLDYICTKLRIWSRGQ